MTSSPIATGSTATGSTLAGPMGRAKALSHIRICDLSGQLAGAGATRFLAAFGAQVIRVEDPVRRARGTSCAVPRHTLRARHRASRSAAGSTTTTSRSSASPSTSASSKAKQLLRKLVAVSDVVTENFAAGVLARMGFPYEELRRDQARHRLRVELRLRRDRPVLVVQDVGADRAGGRAGSPSVGSARPAAGGLGLLVHGPHGCQHHGVAILAGLVHRKRTGEGQWIDMACTEAGTTLTGPDLLDYTVNGRPLRRDGQPDSNHSHAPLMVPHGIYAADGDDNWVAIACRDDADWARLRGCDRRAMGERRRATYGGAAPRRPGELDANDRRVDAAATVRDGRGR